MSDKPTTIQIAIETTFDTRPASDFRALRGDAIKSRPIKSVIYISGTLDVSPDKALKMGVGPGKSFTFEVASEDGELVSQHSGVVPTPLPEGGWRFTLNRRTFVRNLPTLRGSV